ncbi:hypothetical protein [Jiangella alba]|uniref:Sulfotransferase family protein n=1 Tax=Jiangella alba TaxID=561176 RepID=A0A1H5H773_9ACTN|nr:hypothetical protein [Jiangella alba]SEE23770.1 hypothetical protein SAMN04488561_0772 [Jiangella alba]
MARAIRPEEFQTLRVFVLGTGRCGSSTFIKACRHIDNYTAAGGSLPGGEIAANRLDYPEAHIEVDRRLCTRLDTLRAAYGSNSLFIHLRRDPAQVAASIAGDWRAQEPVLRSLAPTVVASHGSSPLELARRYVDSVRAGIESFRATVPYSMTIDLERARSQFAEFWYRIGAEGDHAAAAGEFDRRDDAVASDPLGSAR